MSRADEKFPWRLVSTCTDDRTALNRTWLTFVLVILAAAAASAQGGGVTVDAPPALGDAARRIRAIDQARLADQLGRAGLPLPERIRIVLVAEGDPRAVGTPEWIVGLAAGTRNIVVFPGRIGSYPYGSLESVVRHEIVHLALNTRAAGRPLPRWFHEGVAVAVEKGWGQSDEIRLLLAAFDRPSVADLGRLFASDKYPDTSQAYLLAAALVDEVRTRHGDETPGAIAGAVASGLPFETAFFTVTGERTEEVAARAWAGHRWLTRLVPMVTSPSAVWSLILGIATLAFVFTIRRRRAQRHRWEAEPDDEMAEHEETPEDDGEPPPDVR